MVEQKYHATQKSKERHYSKQARPNLRGPMRYKRQLKCEERQWSCNKLHLTRPDVFKEPLAGFAETQTKMLT